MIRRRVIKSCPEAYCARPWVEFVSFTVTKLGIEFAIAKVSGPAASTECAGVDTTKERALERAGVFAFAPPVPPEDLEPHVLALTLEGTLEFVPLSKQRAIYYAHLAVVDPVTGDADVLQFEQEDHV